MPPARPARRPCRRASTRSPQRVPRSRLRRRARPGIRRRAASSAPTGSPRRLASPPRSRARARPAEAEARLARARPAIPRRHTERRGSSRTSRGARSPRGAAPGARPHRHRSRVPERQRTSSLSSRAPRRERRAARVLLEQLAEPRPCPVQTRLQSAFLEARDLHQLGQRIALDIVQRKQGPLILVQPAPGAVEPSRPECRLGFLERTVAVGAEARGIGRLDRIDVAAIETPQLVDEDAAHHAKQPAVRLIEPLELVEARKGAHADFLHEILRVRNGAREAVSRTVKQRVMPADQRLEPLDLRLASLNECQAGHSSPRGRPSLTRLEAGFVPDRPPHGGSAPLPPVWEEPRRIEFPAPRSRSNPAAAKVRLGAPPCAPPGSP